MARFFQEYIGQREQNLIYILERKLQEHIRSALSPDEFRYLFSGPVSFDDFTSFLIFEAISQDIKDNLDTHSLHEHITDLYGEPHKQKRNKLPTVYFGTAKDNTSKTKTHADVLCQDVDNTYRYIIQDLSLRKEFLFANLKRYNIPSDIEKLAWAKDMRDRSMYRQGHNLTELQFEQLLDKKDFCIKRVHELRRFRDSKHVPSKAVKKYYTSLVSHARKCFETKDAKMRVLYAINLNDFENMNLSFFLYHVAEYCVQHGITTINPNAEQLLLILTAVLHFENTNTTVLHKPTLLLQRLIESALQENTNEIHRYIALAFWGLVIRKQVLAPVLEYTPYDYKEIDDYICLGPLAKYNIFNLYQEPNWDKQGKTIALLRVLIDKLTTDPLPASPNFPSRPK